MYAVLQGDEVVDYFRDKDEAEYVAWSQFELGYTEGLYVVEIISKYD
jgi:hypothetical protein